MSLKLLVADDEAIVRNFIRSVVVKESLPVSLILDAANGIDAVRLTEAEKPDLVFLDVRMPGMTGLEAGALILEKRPETSVFIISAYDEFDYARSAFKTGVLDYLLKPIRSQQIVDIVTKESLERRQRAERETASNNPPLVRAVSEYIESRLDQPLTLTEIAAAVFISPTHLSRKFKALAGRSLTAYIQEKRLNRAAGLLADTDYSITKVASLVGFENPSYFATCFKAATGQPPLKYRKSRLGESQGK